MSSRCRLLSGSAGPPTSLADEGRRHLLIDASEPRPVHPVVLALLESTIGRIMGGLGADGLAEQAWSGLATVAHLSAIREMLDGLADPRFDRVVLDCGSIGSARDLVRAPAIAIRLLDAALTPRLAMWRFPDEAETESTAFEALSDARTELLAMDRALTDPGAVMRILTPESESESERAGREAAAMFGLLGVAAEAWTGSVRTMHAGALSTACSETADGYALDLSLAGAARERSRVGRRGDDLVVELDGVTRWLTLPPVLRRCTAMTAERTGRGLSIRFRPDPDQWRRSEAGGS